MGNYPPRPRVLPPSEGTPAASTTPPTGLTPRLNRFKDGILDGHLGDRIWREIYKAFFLESLWILRHDGLDYG